MARLNTCIGSQVSNSYPPPLIHFRPYGRSLLSDRRVIFDELQCEQQLVSASASSSSVLLLISWAAATGYMPNNRGAVRMLFTPPAGWKPLGRKAPETFPPWSAKCCWAAPDRADASPHAARPCRNPAPAGGRSDTYIKRPVHISLLLLARPLPRRGAGEVGGVRFYLNRHILGTKQRPCSDELCPRDRKLKCSVRAGAAVTRPKGGFTETPC